MTVHYTRHADVRLTALEGEGVVLHLGSRRYYSVSATGLDLLEAIAQPRTLDQLVDLLTAKYDVTPDVASATTREFLELGCRSGLIIAENAD